MAGGRGEPLTSVALVQWALDTLVDLFASKL